MLEDCRTQAGPRKGWNQAETAGLKPGHFLQSVPSSLKHMGRSMDTRVRNPVAWIYFSDHLFAQQVLQPIGASAYIHICRKLFSLLCVPQMGYTREILEKKANCTQGVFHVLECAHHQTKLFPHQWKVVIHDLQLIASAFIYYHCYLLSLEWQEQKNARGYPRAIAILFYNPLRPEGEIKEVGEV